MEDQQQKLEEDKKKIEVEHNKIVEEKNWSLQSQFETTINKINKEKEIEKNKILKAMEDQRTIIKQEEKEIRDEKKRNRKNTWADGKTKTAIRKSEKG
jgi:hypothetical protein